MSAPFVLAPGERHAGAPPLDGPFFRFASSQTDGLLALGEVRLPPLTSGPNLHVHANEDEMFFVLDGVMTVQVADQLYEMAAGGLAWGSRLLCRDLGAGKLPPRPDGHASAECANIQLPEVRLALDRRIGNLDDVVAASFAHHLVDRVVEIVGVHERAPTRLAREAARTAEP